MRKSHGLVICSKGTRKGRNSEMGSKWAVPPTRHLPLRLFDFSFSTTSVMTEQSALFATTTQIYDNAKLDMLHSYVSLTSLRPLSPLVCTSQVGHNRWAESTFGFGRLWRYLKIPKEAIPSKSASTSMTGCVSMSCYPV
jgi:hypothetical protein